MKKELIILNPHDLMGYSFNWEKAFYYAKLMESGTKFPPIRVHQNKDGSFKIRNGMHRTIAAKLCGKEILAEICSKYYSNNDFFEDLENNYRIR